MITVHPTIGLSFLNYGQKSVFYIAEDELDPLPRTRLYGESIKADFINLIGVTPAREREYYSILPNDKRARDGQTRDDYTIGLNLIYTPFQFTTQKEKN